MSKAIELKSAVVAEIAEKLEKAASVIVVDYKGLTVEQVTDLRSQMREAGVDYKVYKNTLVRRAASQIEGEAFANFNDELLVGPNAIAFGYEDAVAPARVLKAFMDKNPNKITLKMGVVEGEFYDEAKIVSYRKTSWQLEGSNVKLCLLIGCCCKEAGRRSYRSLINLPTG